ncbi:hypothetical protein [Nocardioides pacificus]
MFVHVCTACQKRQLIFPSQFTGAFEGGQGGVEVTFTCWCGAEQRSPLSWAPDAPIDQQRTPAHAA